MPGLMLHVSESVLVIRKNGSQIPFGSFNILLFARRVIHNLYSKSGGQI